LSHASLKAAAFAASVENGLGANTVHALGRAPGALPSRGFCAGRLPGFSRLFAQAASQVDHQIVEIEPLEFGTLGDFLHLRRSAKVTQKESIAQSAKVRAAKLAGRSAALVAPTEPAPEPSIADHSADALRAPDPDVTIAQDELDPIRMALSSLPAEAPVTPQATPLAAAHPNPAAQLYVSETIPDRDQDDGVAPQTPCSFADPAPQTLLGKIGHAPWCALAAAARKCQQFLSRTLGPPTRTLAAAFLGWPSVGFLLPYGLYCAVRAHLKGQDLRHFE
jgi:hypothetical protein